MNLKRSVLIAGILSLIFLTSWELYWRSKGYTPDIDDDKNLWANQRAKVDNLNQDDVVLLGSSRVLFDIQLDKWREITGKKPIQLACAGASPLPVLHDLVENTDYKGTILVGVTPGLFFSTTKPFAGPWKRPQKRIDHFYKRTYAQRLNHFLSIPFQQNLALVSVSEEQWSNDIDLRTLLNKVKIGNKRTEGPDVPPFNHFQEIREDRNTRMTDQTVIDTAYANTVKRVWKFFDGDKPPPDKDATLAFFVKDAKKFISKGGNIVLVRCPSTGFYWDNETTKLPRAEFWDILVKQVGSKAYSFDDYESLRFDCPEWSHLSGPDADKFTEELLKIMISEDALIHPKN